MIKFDFSDYEKNILLNYAEKDIQQGHWGDGEVTTFEDKILVNKLKNSSSEINLSIIELQMICNNIQVETQNGKYLSQEDILIIHKINSILENYSKDDKNDEFDINEVKKLIVDLNHISPDKKK